MNYDDVSKIIEQRNAAFREIKRLINLLDLVEECLSKNKIDFELDANYTLFDQRDIFASMPESDSHVDHIVQPIEHAKPAMIDIAQINQIRLLGNLWLNNMDHSLINFDEEFYLLVNDDVGDAIRSGAFTSGFHHWLLHGHDEGRSFRFNNHRE